MQTSCQIAKENEEGGGGGNILQSYFFSTPGPIFHTGINILQRNINRDVFKGVGNWNKKKQQLKIKYYVYTNVYVKCILLKM